MGLLTRVRERFSHALHADSARSDRWIERRHPATRPQDGATGTCPWCNGVLMFREDYRILRTVRNTMEPAWICHTHPCGYREFLRH